MQRKLIPIWRLPPLADGRLIALEIEGSPEFRELCTAWNAYFMDQIEAGMPGYMTVISDGEFFICPHDETSDAVRGMVQAMLDANMPDIAGLKAEAARSGNGTAFRDV